MRDGFDGDSVATSNPPQLAVQVPQVCCLLRRNIYYTLRTTGSIGTQNRDSDPQTVKTRQEHALVLGDLQLQVMEVVWNRGHATVAEVHEVLAQQREIAYTTVLSTLRGLEKRGFLTHTVEGKAHRYHSQVSREEHTQESVTTLVRRLFSGRPEQLMSHLLGTETLRPQDLTRIRELLDDEGSDA